LPWGRLVASSGQEFPLRYDDNLIGRASPGEGIHPAVDLSAADTSGSVSRRHARIGKDDSSIYVEDLGSSNGSRHNGQALRAGMQTPLKDGDELVFGSLCFRFHDGLSMNKI
jgi:pSer/pThr/pTyr-binding forkhead associated (FHA) protein